MKKTSKVQDKIDLKIAQERLESPQFVNEQKLKTYLRKRGIKL